MSSEPTNSQPTDKPYIILIKFNAKAKRAPHVCVFEEMEMRESPNHLFIREAKIGENEIFYYTDTLEHDYEGVSAQTIMDAFNNTNDTKSRFSFVVRATKDVVFNESGDLNLSDHTLPKDITHNYQAETDYQRNLKNGAFKNLNSQLCRT